jgi:hypothetical protein
MTLKTRRQLAAAVLAATTFATILLYRFSPTQYSFYPRCPIHEHFGILCPGCGATRALAALLHGHLAEAWHQNALFTALLPFLIAFTAISLHRAVTQQNFRWPEPPKAALYATAALTIASTITRNLPH